MEPKKILIVDDSEVMRRIHKNTLKEQNIPEESMLEAADGVEALKIALAEQVDLFLVDWNMVVYSPTQIDRGGRWI